MIKKYLPYALAVVGGALAYWAYTTYGNKGGNGAADPKKDAGDPAQSGKKEIAATNPTLGRIFSR